MTNQPTKGEFCGRTRREFLWETGGGFTSVALAAMLGEDGFFDTPARMRADAEGASSTTRLRPKSR